MDTPAHDLTSLYISEHGRLSRFLRRIVGNRAAAEDLVQQAFLRFLPRGHAARPELVVAARNLGLNYLRDGKRRREVTIDDKAFERIVDPTPSPEAVVLHRSELRHLLEAVASLPPRRRQIFVLSRFEGLSHAEIALRLDIAPRTVVNQLVAALATLDHSLGFP
ncbi:RNA polymerase sigma factor [Methylobacterium sp. E-045]|uniref:RNA polymerase sigma factor n=1 Tax=Methylobacterium sp. E-045 TaxID=2836575 RepID=UPI001FB8A068|nr:sigma-70 family RNA polymerase sigma factor [Methylobacterium sp. E-045]MCJ2129266.1 sigma-70 family RNA polymerase sigma factor [Methylobacterium sp. E-045]